MTARRRVAAEITRLAAEGNSRRTWPAVVAQVTPGGAPDGKAAVLVTFRGDTYRATYYEHYTPAVGHVVRVSLDGSLLHIEGRPVGAP